MSFRVMRVRRGVSMEKQNKFRMASWYWGNYCTQTPSGKWVDQNGCFIGESNYFVPRDLEPYIEDEHGWHHSEEYKNGQKEPYKY